MYRFLTENVQNPRNVMGLNYTCMTVKLRPYHAGAFGRVDEAVSGGKPHAGKSVIGMIS